MTLTSLHSDFMKVQQRLEGFPRSFESRLCNFYCIILNAYSAWLLPHHTPTNSLMPVSHVIQRIGRFHPVLLCYVLVVLCAVDTLQLYTLLLPYVSLRCRHILQNCTMSILSQLLSYYRFYTSLCINPVHTYCDNRVPVGIMRCITVHKYRKEQVGSRLENCHIEGILTVSVVI